MLCNTWSHGRLRSGRRAESTRTAGCTGRRRANGRRTRRAPPPPDAGDPVATLPRLTQPTVSRHLRVLREVGLVEVRPDAQRRIYALRADGLVAIDDWINRYRRYWADHLDALERHLESKHKETR